MSSLTRCDQVGLARQAFHALLDVGRTRLEGDATLRGGRGVSRRPYVERPQERPEDPGLRWMGLV